MIFSTDLDRTLIFSRRTVQVNPPVIPIELRQGKPYGFMTAGAFAALYQIMGAAVFLVNTLRGYEQACRVLFAANCPYLACQNGLSLYRSGVLDKDWRNHVARTVGDNPTGLDRAIARVLSDIRGIDCLSKRYEHLAVFFVKEPCLDGKALSQLARELAGEGWELYRQRKKLYLSPLKIDKGAVLNRVRELTSQAYCISFGDSYFDLPMLRLSQKAFSLSGCELEGQRHGLPLIFSSLPAQAGTEEILKIVASAARMQA